MKIFLLFHFAFWSLLVPLFGESEDEKKWRSGLGSPDFSERANTYDLIWAKGEVSIPFLEKLVEGEDPELKLRATSLLRKIRLGITPETPEKIVELIESFFQSSPKGRVVVIEKLIAAQEYGFVLKLRKLEENEGVLFRIDDEVAKVMPRIVAQQIHHDEIEKAKEYLLLSEQFDHLIHYASLLEYSGELEDEIARLREDIPGPSEARYLACLRVKGDPVLLRKEALRLGNQPLADLAAIVMGDHRPHFQSLLEVGDLKLAQRHYLKWALADDMGDLKTTRKLQESVIHLSGMASEERNARTALFKMGLGEPVLNNLVETDLSRAIDFAISSEDYGKAQELIGIPESDKLEAWIEQMSGKAAEEISDSISSRSLNLLVFATEFLEGRGDLDDAARCALALFDLGRGIKDIGPKLIASMLSDAPISLITGIAREIDEFEAEFPSFAKTGFFLLLGSEQIIWLDSLLQEFDKDMSTKDRLLLNCSFYLRRLLVPVETFTKARDQVLARLAEGEDEVAGLQELLSFFASRNRAEDLRLVTQALRKAEVPNVHFEAMLAADLGEYHEAAKRVSGIELEYDSPGYTSYLYLQGLMMKKGRLKEGEVRLEKARRFSNGSADILEGFAEQHLRYGEVQKAYELLKKAFLRRDGGAGQSFRNERRETLGYSLAATAAQLGKWREALAYREIKLANFELNSINREIWASRYRLQLLVARGAVAMEDGNLKKAVKSFTEAHSLLPGDGYLANELFPVVRGLGLTELHDQLFAQSAEYCRVNIRRYPKDDNLYNNFAWLASRANRALDEAQEYLTKALEMNPESAAYLDTMAEIEFARKNRVEAIEWSEKSLANEAVGSSLGRWELQEQNRRFKKGGFPVQ